MATPMLLDREAGTTRSGLRKTLGAWVFGDREEDPAKELLAAARIETKFVTEAANIDSIYRWIKVHRAGFKRENPSRYVNNIYYDTFDYACYGDNLAGISERRKVRARWYHSLLQPSAEGALEFKLKRGKLGWKETYPFSGLKLRNPWKQVNRNIESHLSGAARLAFHSFPMAVLINRYHRDYFLSADRRLRITVDREMEVYDQRIASRPRLSPKLNLPDYVVVELKYAPSDTGHIVQVVEDFPLRPRNSSKYVTALKSITGS